MELVKRIPNRDIIVAKCERCGREIEIPFANTINPYMSSIDLKNVVKCACGEYHNLIIDPKNYRPVTQPPKYYSNNTSIKCPRCGSSQLHSGEKGFSLGKAIAGDVLFGPIGILGGFIGSKKVMITCLKCGYKWEAGKR